MARKDVAKCIFIGAEEDRLIFFQKAQEKGIIHFVDMHEGKGEKIPEEIQHLTRAIKILRGLPTMNQEEPPGYERAKVITEKILAKKSIIDQKEEEIRLLDLEIARLEVFGNFSLEEIAYIEKEGNRFLQFFCSKKGVLQEDPLPPEMFYVGSDHGLDYYLAINKERKTYDKMIEMHFDHSLDSLHLQLKEANETLAKAEKELKGYSKYNTYLHKALTLSFNHHNLDTNSQYPLEELDGSLFYLEGWVPLHRMEDLQVLVEGLGVYYQRVAIEKSDSIPTFLENKGVARIGEDLVHIYDTPSHTDKDPSMWVLSAFALFFGIIVGDAGYGFIYLAIALFLAYKFRDAKGAGKRFIRLTLILSVSCVLWGVITNSYFGIDFRTDSPFRKISVLNWLAEKKVAFHMKYADETLADWRKQYPAIQDARTPKELLQKTIVIKNGIEKNDILNGLGNEILLELALLIGILHIALSFLRYIGRSWSGIGWIMVLVGGYLYFPLYLNQSSLLHYLFGYPPTFGATEGFQLIFVGIGVAVLLSLIQNRWGGLAEPMNLIQVFADVLSYLRLYALGLASAIVSQTINDLASALPILLGIVLIGLAHTINMALGIMSGVIHGLRLNFLEWYHYSFEGGGKPFRPLQLFKVE